MGESLKSNTTLTALNLSGEDKRKKTHKRCLSTKSTCFFLLMLYPIENNIKSAGLKSLTQQLKSNTALTELELDGKRNYTQRD